MYVHGFYQRLHFSVIILWNNFCTFCLFLNSYYLCIAIWCPINLRCLLIFIVLRFYCFSYIIFQSIDFLLVFKFSFKSLYWNFILVMYSSGTELFMLYLLLAFIIYSATLFIYYLFDNFMLSVKWLVIFVTVYLKLFGQWCALCEFALFGEFNRMCFLVSSYAYALWFFFLLQT